MRVSVPVAAGQLTTSAPVAPVYNRPADLHQQPGAAKEFLFSALDRTADGTGMVDLYSGEVMQGVTSRETAALNGVASTNIWPKSYTRNGISTSDLHMLAPTRDHEDRYRWKLPYGEVVEPMDSKAPAGIKHGTGSVGFDDAGRLVYEPRDAAKGVVARSMIYAHEQYSYQPLKPSNWDRRPFRDSLPTLLAWNAAFLPDAAELRRNDLIAGYQGNRNRYIDDPERAAQWASQATTRDAPSRDSQLNDWLKYLKNSDPAIIGRSKRPKPD